MARWENIDGEGGIVQGKAEICGASSIGGEGR